VAVGLSATIPGRAQSPNLKDRLIAGSADTIHDVQGIAIGMTCDEAIARAQQIHAPNYGPGNPSHVIGGVTLDGHRLEYHSFKYAVPLRMLRSRVLDQADFSCLAEGGSGVVFEVHRQIQFARGEAAPAIASLRGVFQEKYGVPGIEYSPFVLTTLFNRKGLVTEKEGSCVGFSNGHLYEAAFTEFNADKCSYELDFTANESRDHPGSITSIDIFIRDHLRLENALRDSEQHRLETTPVIVPKL
jgi:hypothetical protein